MKKLLVLLFIIMMALPVFAQDAHTIHFDGVGFTITDDIATSVNITRYAGDPVEGAGAGFSDAAHTQFVLYSTPPAPESLFDRGGVRFYHTADLAQYSFMQEVVTALEVLLANPPDQSPSPAPLPFLPVATHGQALTAAVGFIETDSVRGIRYLTVNQATAEPFLSNSFYYTFQGISTDGAYYVSAVLPVTTATFPTQLDDDFDPQFFSENLASYHIYSAEVLNAAQSDDFAPSLDSLDTLARSISIGASVTAGTATLMNAMSWEPRLPSMA